MSTVWGLVVGRRVRQGLDWGGVLMGNQRASKTASPRPIDKSSLNVC